eukprot:c26144_g1_i1 orf=610-2091(-)
MAPALLSRLHVLAASPAWRESAHGACSSFHNLAQSCQNGRAQGILFGCGHHVTQKMLVYNRVVKNKLLLKKRKDHAFEDLMDNEKKYAKLQRIIAILLQQPREEMLYRYLIRQGDVIGLGKPQRVNDILKKYPHIFDIYEEPRRRQLCVSVGEPALALIEEEKKCKEDLIPMAISRLRKLLMMSSTRRICLNHITCLKQDLGLPDAFRERILEKYPLYFRIVERGENSSPLVELVDWDPHLAVAAIEKQRQKEALEECLSAEEIKRRAFSFPINYPPGYRQSERYKARVKRWLALPYRSPYQDSSDLCLKSSEARKRAVAVLHEYLHLTVERRTNVNRVANLREDLKLPQKVGVTVLEQPGIFYLSTKGTGQTIFLREGYHKGQLIEKDALNFVKDKFMDLIWVGKRGKKNAKLKIDETKFERQVRGTEVADEAKDRQVANSEWETEGEGPCEEDDSAFTEESDECDSSGEDDLSDSDDEHIQLNDRAVDKIA